MENGRLQFITIHIRGVPKVVHAPQLANHRLVTLIGEQHASVVALHGMLSEKHVTISE